MSSNGKRTRRSHSEQFKQDAVNLVVVEDYSFAAAARAVNVSAKSLREWHAKYAPDPEACVEDATVEQLQTENKRFAGTTPSRTGT